MIDKYSYLAKYILVFVSFLVLTMVEWILRETLTLPNFTMIYILFVLIVAIQLGTYAAMSAAFVSFLCINFLLTQPYYTFLVADSRDVLGLTVFIIVAVLSGQLGARARLQAEVAYQRAQEQTILYKLTGMMNQTVDSHEVHRALNRVLLEDLGASQVYILPDETETPKPSDKASYLLLLKAHDKVYGTVSVRFVEEIGLQKRQLVMTCVTQSAMALQRIELTERARASQQYEEADRLKTAILRAVSHDLRTPITIIKTSASNLQALGEKLMADERREIAQGIENEADYLNKLVGNLLDLSRLQAGAITLNRELNSLEEVAGDAVARVWQMTGKERVQLYFPEDMPLVNFDYGLILQAISNLIDNALHYEPEDSFIKIEAHIENSQASIRIINHGETIHADEREHVMEPFFSSKHGGHVGLGLPIAKEIAEVHHGELLLEDTPGSGATFILVLPMNVDGV